MMFCTRMKFSVHTLVAGRAWMGKNKKNKNNETPRKPLPSLFSLRAPSLVSHTFKSLNPEINRSMPKLLKP